MNTFCQIFIPKKQSPIFQYVQQLLTSEFYVSGQNSVLNLTVSMSPTHLKEPSDSVKPVYFFWIKIWQKKKVVLGLKLLVSTIQLLNSGRRHSRDLIQVAHFGKWNYTGCFFQLLEDSAVCKSVKF